jgi:hypothetical protein
MVIPFPGARCGHATVAGRPDSPLSVAGRSVAFMDAPAAGGPALSPEDRFADLVDEFAGLDGVTPPSGGSGFGRSALRFRRKIFAMFVRGRLVLKLPAARVDELVASGAGLHFDANKGIPMKEWLSLDPDSDQDWVALAREALTFAGGA